MGRKGSDAYNELANLLSFPSDMLETGIFVTRVLYDSAERTA